MYATMNREDWRASNDMDFAIPRVSSPESDLRSNALQQEFSFQYSGLSDYTYPHGASKRHQSAATQSKDHGVQQCHFAAHNGNFPSSECNGILSYPMHQDFSIPNGSHNSMADSATDSTYPDIMDDQELAAALASYQPCDDCTPSTKTTIPHHHHPSGKLAGASATQYGHFCCSWLVHGEPCLLCFQSAEALDNHIKTDHAGKDGDYRCLWQDCSKHDSSATTSRPMNFGNKPKLMRHVHSHTGYKPFPCLYPGCDKGFVTKEQLKNHETTHTKSRKYQCDQCGKAFAVKSALTTHITAVHEEKKTHRCEICGKAFADSSNLSKHKQTHFRESGIRKQRSRRGTSTVTSTRSSPSISTPSAEPATPVVQSMNFQEFPHPQISSGLMGPPAVPKVPNPFSTLPPGSYSGISTMSTTSSPPPESFDPNCYCCEQRCPPPEGPPTPCNEAEDCDRDGFCDLPDCFVQNDYGSTVSSPEMSMSAYQCGDSFLGHQQIDPLRNFQLPPQWDDMLEQDSQRPFSQRELEEQFTNMHGS